MLYGILAEDMEEEREKDSKKEREYTMYLMKIYLFEDIQSE